jgi:hypothetical protein
MKGFLKFAVICVAISLGCYAAYSLVFPTAYLRYRLTLDVDVDGVMRAGSGVIEISYQPPPDFMIGAIGGNHFRGKMHGYAITVDLGDRGLLFVIDARPDLAEGKTDKSLFPGRDIFPNGATLTTLPLVANDLPPEGMPSVMLRLVNKLRNKHGVVDVPPEKLPMLVRFRDIGKRQSMGEVDPRDLSSAFGPGVNLVGARVEVTNDPITPMPSIWPKWLADEADERFPLQAYTNYLSRNMPLSTKVFKGE